MGPLYINGMHGLGDTIYERAIMKQCNNAGIDVWLTTSWPQLFVDLPRIRSVTGRVNLRTQAKNVHTARALFHKQAPKGLRPHLWHYCNRIDQSMLSALEANFPIKFDDINMDLPEQYAATRDMKPYVIVRPVTLRKEWRADSRNCRPEYIAQAVEKLRARFKVVMIADIQAGKEWIVGDMPYYDYGYIHGELSLPKIISMVRGAAAVISPVGWTLPMCLATTTPLLCIMGGQGLHNNIARLTDCRIDDEHIKFAVPDNFCMCGDKSHECDKTISGFDHLLTEWAESL